MNSWVIQLLSEGVIQFLLVIVAGIAFGYWIYLDANDRGYRYVIVWVVGTILVLPVVLPLYLVHRWRTRSRAKIFLKWFLVAGFFFIGTPIIGIYVHPFLGLVFAAGYWVTVFASLCARDE